MSAARPFPAVFVLAVSLTAAGASAALAAPAVFRRANDACLACHSDPGLKRTSGTPVFVDERAFRAAEGPPHARLACVDCHAALRGVEDFPHGPKLPAAACASCHRETVARVRSSVHGPGRSGSSPRPGAVCADCHGSHGIRRVADPASPANPGRLPETCGRCHPGAGPHYAQGKVHGPTGRSTDRWEDLAGAAYSALVIAVVAAFLLYIGADVAFRARTRLSRGTAGDAAAGAAPGTWIGEEERLPRMSRAQRVQHAALILSFALLMLTGVPLMLLGATIVRGLLPGLMAARAAVHRGAAVLLVLDLGWMGAYYAFTRHGRSDLGELRPRKDDLLDALQAFGRRIGLTPRLARSRAFGRAISRSGRDWSREPDYGRYDFIEKFEFWAVAWGSAIMVATGFFMGEEALSLRLFPLWVHNVFVTVHGYEAILALLAVAVWHMYNVHLSPAVFPMSRIWLEGTITGRELRLRHPKEYARIAAGRAGSSGSDLGKSLKN